MAERSKARFLGQIDRMIFSTYILVTFLRLWTRRFTMIVFAWWLCTRSKFSGREFEEIHKNIESLETPKHLRVSSSTK